MSPEEWFDLVDLNGRRIGTARRSECHGNPALLHQAVHVFVFNRCGEVLLQKRSQRKDTQPGKWDSSVGGHVDRGEEPEAAARREMREELGVEAPPLTFAYVYHWTCPVESERIHSFLALHDGPFRVAPAEVEEVRFWSAEEINAKLHTGIFTPNFQEEWPRLSAWRSSREP